MHHLLYFLSVGNLVKPYSKCSKVSINQSKVQGTILKYTYKCSFMVLHCVKVHKMFCDPNLFKQTFFKIGPQSSAKKNAWNYHLVFDKIQRVFDCRQSRTATFQDFFFCFQYHNFKDISWIPIKNINFSVIP